MADAEEEREEMGERMTAWRRSADSGLGNTGRTVGPTGFVRAGPGFT